MEKKKTVKEILQKNTKPLSSKANMQNPDKEICKQLFDQVVGFDMKAATLKVEDNNRFPISPGLRRILRWQDMEKLNIPLEKAIEHYILDLRSQNRSSKTMIWYYANLQAFVLWLKRHRYSVQIGDINIDNVRRYIVYLQDEHTAYQQHPYTPNQKRRLSDYSVQGHVRTLRAFCSWLCREEYISENFLARLKLPKAIKEEIRPLTQDEIGRILSSQNPQTATGARAYAIMYLMLDSGLRVSEVSNLQMENVFFSQGQLLVRGKGNKERAVPMGSNCQKYLQRYIYHFRPEPIFTEQNHVFLALNGKPLQSNAIKLFFTRLRSKTGVKRLHAHLLRHTFATYYLRNGGDLISLQKILGHTTLEMVKVYLHLVDSDVSAMHRQYSPMDRLNVKTSRQLKNRKHKELLSQLLAKE